MARPGVCRRRRCAFRSEGATAWRRFFSQAVPKRFRACSRTEFAKSPFPREAPRVDAESQTWLAPTRGSRPRAPSRERRSRPAISRVLTYRNRGHEFEREQERAALLAGFREQRSQNREERYERERHAPEPRWDDTVIPDEVQGSRDGGCFGLRHHERRVRAWRARECVRARPSRPAGKTTRIQDPSRIFRGSK